MGSGEAFGGTPPQGGENGIGSGKAFGGTPPQGGDGFDKTSA